MILSKRCILFVALFIFAACKKQSQPPLKPVTPSSIYKIELVSGANQTDTVGHQLKTEVLVNVYKNGALYGNSLVYFQVSGGCSDDYSVYSFTAVQEGINGYNWNLNEVPGVQTLKIVLCDLQKNHLDSISITANALKASGKGILTPACVGVVPTNGPEFYKLNSGRIIANFVGSPRYSDDNGISWRPITALNNAMVRKMVIAPDDKIFALVSGGLIYSADKGITWSLLVKDDPFNISLTDITYTRNGKLFYADNTGSRNIYLSTNNGKSFKTISLPGIYGDLNFYGLAEQSNGNLYILGDAGALLKSTDGGVNWSLVNAYNSASRVLYEAMFIDDNDNIYLWRNDYTPGLYVSTDNTQTVSRINFNPDVFAAPDIYADQITKQHDGYYYIRTVVDGVYRTKDFVNIEHLNSRYNLKVTDAVIANNNNLIVATGEYRALWYIPN
ncbi:BNR/Asp-box repeat protein [Mucilaginibacter frigoritolerans]|uniref:BNR/Asp-box repeat protein n=1 Tax=Mucilaginibacter frigoritolerans TaxID=652788 RepID=A0A562U626_9SPHI|nr:sialidase family protein [Mucilaginibacter frigoritolerans]TWJ00837.1 BNR/Asp-box repeat protein [Mucilaginibacter frigoritolerans]